MATYSGSITSNVFQIDNKKSHSISWYDKLTTTSGTGFVRLYCYTNSGTTPTSPAYLEFTLVTGGVSSDWIRYSYPIYAYNAATPSGSYSLPSGTTHGMCMVGASGTTGITKKRYIQGVDFSEGLVSPGYSPSTIDATWIIGDGIVNGSINVGSPIMRTSYEHLAWRQWKSEDAAMVPSKGLYITYEDTDAVNLEEYSYVIDAEDINGNRSPLSTVQTIMAGDVFAPAQVSGLTATAGPLAVSLSYQCPADLDFSHVNIYSNSGLTSLIKTEFGVPATNDVATITNLVGDQSYTFWVTSVDRYGNENRTSAPSGTATPYKNAGDEQITVSMPDKYVKAETASFNVIVWVALSGYPTVTLSDNATPTRHTISPATLVSGSAAGVLPAVYNGTFTVLSGNPLVAGSGFLTASGTTSSGTTAKSNIYEVYLDYTPPTVSSPEMYNYDYYDGGTKYFYKNPVAYLYALISDAGGVDVVQFRESGTGGLGAITNKAFSSNPFVGDFICSSSDGVKTLQYRAVDKAGNQSTFTPINFYIDSLPPIVEIVNNATWITGTTATITFSGKDDTRVTSDVSGFKHVWSQYKIGNGAWSTPSGTTDGQNPCSIYITGITGNVTLLYKGVDNCGNASDYPEKLMQVDNVAPRFTSNPWSLCNGVPAGYALKWLPANIVDDAPSSGLKEITLYRNTTNASGTATAIATVPFSGSSVFYDLDPALRYYTTYYWWMKVKDNAGNESAWSVVQSGQIAHDIKGIFRNFINNGSFERLDNAYSGVNLRPIGWAVSGSPSCTGIAYSGGQYAAKVNSTNYYVVENFPFVNHNTGRRWIMSFYAREASGFNSDAIVDFVCRDANGTKTTVTYTGTSLTTTYARKSFTIGNNGDKTIPASTLGADIYFRSSNAYDIFYDDIQFERPELNGTTTPTDFVDSYVTSADILQGHRIIGDQIEANTITTEHLVVKPAYPNLLKNSSFEQKGADWTLYSGTIGTGGAKEGYYRCQLNNIVGGGSYAQSSPVIVSTGNTYCLSSWVYGAIGTAIAFELVALDQGESEISTLSLQSGIPTNNTYVEMYATFGANTARLFPANTAKVIAKVRNTVATAVQIDCVQLTQGSLPVQWNDGGVTTIDGGNITALSVTAGTIAAGAITADKISAGAITAEKMSVGFGNNMIKNPSFDIGQDGIASPTATYWTLYQASVISGTNTLYSKRGIGFINNTAYVTQNETNVKNLTYVDRTKPICLSMYIKGPASANGAQFQLQQYDSSGNEIGGVGNGWYTSLPTCPSSTTWARQYVTLESGSLNASTVKVRIAVQSKNSSVSIDNLQMEYGTTPSEWETGSTTTIDGDSITTGLIQSQNKLTSFDLDNAVITCTDSSGNYSKLDAGQLVFYNATTAAVQNYAQNITYIDPPRLVCGTAYVFSGNERHVNPPYVMLQPMRIPTYTSGNAMSQYVGWTVENITATGFTPRCWMYSGVATTTTETFTPSADVTLNATDSNAVGAGDVTNNQCTNTSCNKIAVWIRVKNDSTSGTKTTLNGTIRVSSDGTYAGSNILATGTFSQHTIGGSTEWNDYVKTFIGLSSGDKSIKVDWVSGGTTANQTMQLYQVQYISEPLATEITGSGLCGALIIGKTI